MIVPASAPDTDAVPQALQWRRQWVLWRLDAVGEDRFTKVPYQPSGEKASHDDPSTWSSFEDVTAALRDYDGIGFVFSESDPYGGADLDRCFNDSGTLLSWAVPIVQLAQDMGVYIERTPSGRGLHLIGRCRLTRGRSRRNVSGHDPRSGVEMYSRLRYFTVTGEQIGADGDVDADLQPVIDLLERTYFPAASDDAEIPVLGEVDEVRADKLAASFELNAHGAQLGLWRGQFDAQRHRSASEARLALLTRIALFLGPEATIDMVRAVALRAPFIKNDAIPRRKWPRLAEEECRKAITHALQIHAQDQLQVELTPRVGAGVAQPEGLILSLDELGKRAGSLRWLIKGLMPLDSLGLVYGASQSFKSFVVLDCALHVAHGMQWCDKRTRPAPALYVAGEGGAGLHNRIEAWHKVHGRDPKAARLGVVVQPLTLNEAAHLAALQVACDQFAQAMGEPPALVVIDTLSQTFAGNENSAEDMGRYLKVVGAAIRARYGACVVIVHHTGHTKPDQAEVRPRGSSVLGANPDFLLLCERAEGQFMTALRATKQKDAELTDLAFHLERVVLGQDEDGDEVSSLVARASQPGAEAAAAIVQSNTERVSKDAHALAGLIELGEIEHEGTLRERFYQNLGELAPEAKKKRFQRAKKQVLEAGLFVVRGVDWVRADPRSGGP